MVQWSSLRFVNFCGYVSGGWPYEIFKFSLLPCAVVVGFFMTGLLLDVVQVSDSLLLVTLGTLVFTVLLFPTTSL